MKIKSLAFLLSAGTLLGAVPAFAQPANSQAGGLPALAAEVAALRAMVENLQEQIGGSTDPYAGTYAVTIMETALFGCRAVNNPPPNNYIAPYFLPLTNSSVSVSSASFEAEADGETLSVPEFQTYTQELRLSGFPEHSTDFEEGGDIVIGGDGSLYADFGDSILTGQFSHDGSMFSAVVIGDEPGVAGESCSDAWTVHVTGLRK